MGIGKLLDVVDEYSIRPLTTHCYVVSAYLVGFETLECRPCPCSQLLRPSALIARITGPYQLGPRAADFSFVGKLELRGQD